MDQWLVRTVSNRIEGPYSREQVIGFIREGRLGLQDEVCQANQYWIFLHEQHEVQRQLGIHMPRGKGTRSIGGTEEEITETQTETDLKSPVAPPAHDVPKDLSEEYDGSTAVIHRSKPVPPSPAPRPRREPSKNLPPAISVAGASVLRAPLERSSVWRGLAWIMVAVALVIIVAVLELLKTSG